MHLIEKLLSEEDIEKEKIKLIHIFGPSQSGKSSFVIRLCENRFEQFYIPSIGQESNQCKCVINGYFCTINFVVQNYADFNPLEINKNDYIFVFFDESSSLSLTQAKQFIALIREHKSLNDVECFLVGNKCEIKNYSDEEHQLNVFCKAYDVKLFHISVQNNTGIPFLLKSLENKTTYF